MKCSGVLKTAACFAAAILFWIQAPEAQAKDVVDMNTGIAGMSEMMDEYYEARFNYDPDLSPSQVNTDMSIGGTRLKAVSRIPSPYENLAVANVQDYVNIRSGPSTDSEKVGKLYRGCVADVLAIEGDWVKISSGKVEEGYISKEYLLFGSEAEELMEEVCTKYAEVICTTLNVREGQSTDTKIVTQIPLGEKYIIREEFDGWAKIVLGIGDETGSEIYGYVSKDYIEISYDFDYAISKQEEEEQLAREEAARKAEQERLAELARQQAAAQQAANSSSSGTSGSSSSKNNSSSSSSGNSSSSTVSKPSTSATGLALGKEIAEYAVKFVGNPYQWGGTSLTNGADCSGFVYAVYKQFGYTLPRVSRDQSKSAGVCEVKPTTEYLQPGDLIFYGNSSGRVDHVAMYIGNGKVVHASNYKEGIKISAYNYRTPINARRIVE